MNNDLDACYVCPVCHGASGLAVHSSTCFDCLYPEGTARRLALIADTRALVLGTCRFTDSKLPYDRTIAFGKDTGGLHPHELPADFREASI